MIDNNSESGIKSKVLTMRIIFFAMQAAQIIFLIIATIISGNIKPQEQSILKIITIVLVIVTAVNLTASIIFGYIVRPLLIRKAPDPNQAQTNAFNMLLIASALTESAGLFAGINIILGNSLTLSLGVGIFCIAFQWVHFPTESKFQTVKGIDSTDSILRP